MTGVIERTVVTGPGVYDIDEETYHASAALSSSGARTLIGDCPAIFEHERRNGTPTRKEFDLGACAHTLVLGVGREIVVTTETEWRTDKVKREVAEARARGAVPLKPKDFDTVRAMADALRRHPDADEVFAPGGVAERSLFWTDPETGVFCRARPDWIGNGLSDYKSTTDVSLDHIRRTIANFGYHQQIPWYLDGAVALDLVPADAPFRLVFQMKTDPYLVSIVEIDDAAMEIGRDLNRLARQMFRDCTATDIWPSYTHGIETVSLPAYVERRHFEGAYA
jgi:hypothetical protein